LTRFGYLASGLRPQGLPPPSECRRLGGRLDDLAWDSVWVADRLASDRPGLPLLEGVATAAAYAGMTRRVAVGISVLVAPTRPPFLLAKQLATVDYLSEGRLMVGVGIGVNPSDYASVALPYHRRGRLADELIPALRACWSGGPACFVGAHYRFQSVWLDPPPVQAGGPPILVGGTSRAALRRAGRLGDGWIAYQVSPEAGARGVAEARAEAERAGRDPSRLRFALLIPVHVGPDSARARSEAQAAFSRRWGREIPMDVIEETCLVGTPGDALERIAAFVGAGFQELILNPLAGDSDVVGHAERLAAELVEPARRALA
jgi:probable F420-dependent oxidoreductase